jgi:hypothetical protein
MRLCAARPCVTGGCEAEGNGGAGFCCEDLGCRLIAGAECAARSNRGAAGFLARDGGSVKVEEGCVSRGNEGWGYLATGKRAALLLGRGCREAAEAHGGGSDREGVNLKGAVKTEHGGKLL